MKRLYPGTPEYQQFVLSNDESGATRSCSSYRVNPGETLRKARELKNWSQADVATQLNLTLQALHLKPANLNVCLGTFTRGYIRAYAKLLGMDQSRLVIDFDQFTGTDSQGSSVHALGRIEEPARLSHSLLRFASVAVLAVLLVISFFWWQERAPKNLSDSLASAPLEHVEVESADGTTQISSARRTGRPGCRAGSGKCRGSAG